MGKMGLKLLHATPYMWFYKAKEVAETADATDNSSPFSGVCSTKPLYKPSVNHKAVDIPFPSADRMPFLNLSKGGINANLNLDFSIDSANRRCRSADMDAERGGGVLSVLGNRNNGKSLDMNELMRRLESIGPEERRKYFTSRMFWIASPTPIVVEDADNGSDDERARALLDVGYEVASKPFQHQRPNRSVSVGQSMPLSLDSALERTSPLRQRNVLSEASTTPALAKPNYVTSYATPTRIPEPKGSSLIYDGIDNSMTKSVRNSYAIATKALSPRNNQEASYQHVVDCEEKCLHRSNPPLNELCDHEEESSSLPLEIHESDDQIKRHQRLSKKDFSYADSKERLLSGRYSFDGVGEYDQSESEIKTVSNNSTLKLRDRYDTDKHAPHKSASHHSYKHHNTKDTSVKIDSFSGCRKEAEEMSMSERGEAIWYQEPLKSMKEKPGIADLQYAVNTKPHESKVLDSYAVVKSSYNPTDDFRDSMREMVIEKELCSPNDMVELLQCYLTLNTEMHHETIVTVLREVWSELYLWKALGYCRVLCSACNTSSEI